MHSPSHHILFAKEVTKVYPVQGERKKMIGLGWQGAGKASGAGNIAVAVFGKYNLPHSGYNNCLYLSETATE